MVRGLPALAVYVGVLDVRRRASLAFLQAPALPLLVVITEIGLASHQMRPQNATALVGAGMVSVLLFPLIGFALAGDVAGPVREDRMDESDPAQDML